MQIISPTWLLQQPDVQQLLTLALQEDIGQGDATSQALLSPLQTASLTMVTRQPIVVAGLPIAAAVFQRLDARCQCTPLRQEGAYVPAGTALMRIEGQAQALLSAERTALNWLQRMCGIATLTRRYAQAIAHTPCRLLDTRKTIPGHRLTDKYATRLGGAQNHRIRLDDRVMIKDNHIALHGSLTQAVHQAQLALQGRGIAIEVECDTLPQVQEALACQPDYILLDNMPPAMLQKAVAMRASQPAYTAIRLEASGGVTLQTIAAIAETGVDYISVGALTHSATAVDIGLDVVVK